MGDAERSDLGVVGFTSHNARVVQIRRFCASPPNNAELLRLAVAGDSGETLCSWPKDECARDRGQTIPEAVSMSLEEHTEALEREVVAILAWCRADGSTIITKRLRARPQRAAVAMPGMSLEETAAIVGDGDQRAFVGAAIRASEFYLRSYLQGHHQQASQGRDLCEAAIEQAKMNAAMAMEMSKSTMDLMRANMDLMQENNRLRAECEVLTRQVADLLGAESQEAAPETDAARAELIKMVGEGIQKVAPEAWQAVRLYMFQKAQQAAQTAGPTVHAAAAE